MTTLRGQFDGKALVPVEPVDLQAGQLYEVDLPTPPSAPQALLHLLQSLPKLPPEGIDQMEAEIKRSGFPADIRPGS